MNSEGIDLRKLSKLILPQTDYITCLECCKYYIAPETASCGHSLCHNCWRYRKSCPQCSLPVEKKLIKPNLPLQKLAEHVQTLLEAYKNNLNLILDEVIMETELESLNDPSKNVTDWLTSSQNHFSAPPALSSENMSGEMSKTPNHSDMSLSKIQIHTITRKKDVENPKKSVHVPVTQCDWDKIEVIEDSDVNKNKENVIGPMDIEPFYVDEREYTANHPRRSLRNREHTITDVNLNNNNNSIMEKDNKKDEMDKISNNAKQNWNNVKKMRKEFSKLNKINRNKLNVSIEMCKKSQNTAKTKVIKNANTPQAYEIDDNTPQVPIDDFPDIEMTKVISSKQKEVEVSNSEVTAMENSNSKHRPDNLPPIPDISQSFSDDTLQRSKLSHHVNETSIEPKDRIIHKFQLSNETKDISPSKNPAQKHNQSKMPFYKKGALYTPNVQMPNEERKEKEPTKSMNHTIESNTNDDIEITIKVGNTVTNIVIKKKNDNQLHVKSDKEVQTSTCTNDYPQTVKTRNVLINIDSNNEINVDNKTIAPNDKMVPIVQKGNTPVMKQSGALKSSTTKKDTASADTGTVNFEITESVEKELSNSMECANVKEIDQQKAKSNSTPNKSFGKASTRKSQSQKTSQSKTTPKMIAAENASQYNKLAPQLEEMVCLDDDADIFESDTVKDTNVNLIKYDNSKTPSDILISTHKNKTQRTEKRSRDENNEKLPVGKKQKVNYSEKVRNHSKSINQPDSESLTYDNVMGTVFASIDADMEELSQHPVSQKQESIAKNKGQTQKTQKNVEGPQACTLNTNDFCIESENIFSVPKTYEAPANEPLPIVEDFLTPILSGNHEILSDDSQSVLEDTPQKVPSFAKLNQKTIASKDQNASQSPQTNRPGPQSGKSIRPDKAKIKNLDTFTEIDDENQARNSALETPLTINKFVTNIQYNSTPAARKSLNFENDVDVDIEQTLCSTNVVKTTQEKQFLSKAFEESPTSQIVQAGSRNVGVKRVKQLCIAGSCLSAGETFELNVLCSRYKWNFVDKYTKDLTHLVVGVDEENKAQRSVKYMCALAASKWIVSFEWVKKCLKTNAVVGEEVYEAVDTTGEPGPRRSRLANRKLFQGITFYCMEPFVILDVHTLKEMLEASGGRVVSEVSEVRVTEASREIALLVAEPESTQEDRFVYLAMKQSIVPVNYEWVLNCLGRYSLSSIRELLLCPAALLPRVVDGWPDPLMRHEQH